MRWFLLPCDPLHPVDKRAIPFQPKIYPHPSPCSSRELTPWCEVEGGNIKGLPNMEGDVEGPGPPDKDGNVGGVSGDAVESKNGRDDPDSAPRDRLGGVCFQSPPKAIFSPTVEVCVRSCSMHLNCALFQLPLFTLSRPLRSTR